MREHVRTFLACLACGALVTVGCTHAAAADRALPPGPYVSTSGKARVEQMPDYALVSIRLVGEGENAEGARDALVAAGTDLNAVLERFAAAVGDRRLRTVGVNPRFRRTDSGERKLEGYRAEQTVVIRVDDLKRLNPLYYALAALNTAGLGSPSYRIADESNVRERARSLALQNARQRAEMLANSLGARLGTVWGVVYRSMHNRAGGFSTGVRRADLRTVTVNLASSGSQLSIPLDPEPIPYVATVGVIYRLEPETSSSP